MPEWGSCNCEPPTAPLPESTDNCGPSTPWPPPLGTSEQAVLLGVLGKEGAELAHQGLEVVGALVVPQGPGEGLKAGPAQRLLHGRHEEPGPAHLRPGRRSLLLDTRPSAPSDAPSAMPPTPVPSRPRQAGGTHGKDGRPSVSSTGADCSLCPWVQAPPSTSSPRPWLRGPSAHSQGQASAPQGLTAPRSPFVPHTLG